MAIDEARALEGNQAPPFALRDQHGEVVRSDALRGHWTVLWWYPKAATAG